MTSEPPTGNLGGFLFVLPKKCRRALEAERIPNPFPEGSTPSVGAQQSEYAAVVNSADTSVFQTEAEGSMPSGRSQDADLAQLVEAHG